MQESKLKLSTWMKYWFHKLNIGGVFPDRVSIPERFYLEMLNQYPFIGCPEKFMGMKIRVIYD